jgi:hypothetical protein
MSDPGNQLRQACADALRQWTLVEQQAGQAQAQAQRQRETALSAARAANDQARQQADTLIHEARAVLQESDRVLADLQLTPERVPPAWPPSGTRADELARQLQQQRAAAGVAQDRLQATAATLRQERRKWWKFW